MKTEKTNFKDLLIFKSKNFSDKRGFFRELSIEKNIKKRLVFTVSLKVKKKCFARISYANKK
jgi:dTDP-4-dehydrorhamnose 3,5-epimerase-like enzyme